MRGREIRIIRGRVCRSFGKRRQHRKLRKVVDNRIVRAKRRKNQNCQRILCFLNCEFGVLKIALPLLNLNLRFDYIRKNARFARDLDV